MAPNLVVHQLIMTITKYETNKCKYICLLQKNIEIERMKFTLILLIFAALTMEGVHAVICTNKIAVTSCASVTTMSTCNARKELAAGAAPSTARPCQWVVATNTCAASTQCCGVNGSGTCA